jgi:hypothetical protein
MMRIVKLTRQYNGYGLFTHRVEFRGGAATGQREIRIRQWIRVRNWLWTQFGPSAEQDLARASFFDGVQPKWAWDTEKSAIYLAEEAFTMFSLRKEFWENAENL